MKIEGLTQEVPFEHLRHCRKNVKNVWARGILCGVYYLRCTVNGRIYIGSSVWIRKRILKHKRDLTSNEHDNPHLQASFNKYGIGAFVIGVLNTAVDERDAKTKEQHLIDQYSEAGIELFNIAMGVVFPNHEHLARTISLVSPEGDVKTITNIQKFCRENDLSNAAIYRVLSSNYKHKGWSRVGRDVPEDWKVTSPSGEHFSVPHDVIGTFCTDHGISRRHLRAVWKGVVAAHKGWTRFDFPRLKMKSPNGNVVSIPPKGLARFCREHSISETSVLHLSKGVIQTCKGWTLVGVA